MPTNNPNWARDELILALDLYFEIDFANARSDKNPKIEELSKLLNSLPIHEAHFRGEDFRNRDGVSMKLSNFLRFDPHYSGEGLNRGSKLDKQIWDEFSSDLPKLRNTARLIREGLRSLPTIQSESESDEEYSEGQILTRLHRVRERNSTLTKKKKAKILKETGSLKCEVCEFDFRLAYGELGEGYAECHHTIPLSSLEITGKTRLSDLSIVCANCHRMLHRSRGWLSIEELKRIVSAARIKR